MIRYATPLLALMVLAACDPQAAVDLSLIHI